MLGDKISNQEEDEVEDELAALEAELGDRDQTTLGSGSLPSVPDTALKGDSTHTGPEPAPVQHEERQAIMS